MIPLSHFLLLSALVFGIGMAGLVTNRRHIIMVLMCIELMLLAVNINFVALSHYSEAIAGQTFVFFILTVAAAEVAIGLSILLVFYRRRGTINIEQLNELKG
jgi:NADH-quinone oxidoreductase subunit K